ncbi:MAG: hypothetical protein HOW97_14105 [Catenulispora sp.]|nr:hypothetical protein [Catenulispora sp.]
MGTPARTVTRHGRRARTARPSGSGGSRSPWSWFCDFLFGIALGFAGALLQPARRARQGGPAAPAAPPAPRPLEVPIQVPDAEPVPVPLRRSA